MYQSWNELIKVEMGKDYFKNIIDGKIPKTGNTTLHYYYAEDERKLFGNSFVGDISYEDLTIYYKKINDFLKK